MKNPFSILALLVSIATLYISLTNGASQDQPENVQAENEYPLLETMGYYQRFSQKLWFALEKENWELADFYVHELEEVTEEFVEAGVVDEGIELSQYAEMMLAPAVEELNAAIEGKKADAVTNHYRLLINACNACHVSTNHAFIKIEIPEVNKPYNQNFGE